MPLHPSKTHLRLAVDKEIASLVRLLTEYPEAKAQFDRRLISTTKQFIRERRKSLPAGKYNAAFEKLEGGK